MKFGQDRKAVVLVTGATAGIGREVAEQLARKGLTVWIGARDAERGEAVAAAVRRKGGEARFLPLDVADETSRIAAVGHLEQQHDGLDILINNAGIFRDNAAPSQVDLELVRETFETNLFGALAMMQLALPLLLRSSAGRIVNMSSGLGSLTQNSDPAYEFAQVKALGYNMSKAALNMATTQFAYELKDTKIKVNAADPGYTATQLNGHRGYRSVEQAAKIVLQLAMLDDSGPTGGFFDETGEVPW